jgi:hypothetical protein
MNLQGSKTSLMTYILCNYELNFIEIHQETWKMKYSVHRKNPHYVFISHTSFKELVNKEKTNTLQTLKMKEVPFVVKTRESIQGLTW